MKHEGKFIVIEGIEGSGKSTLLKRVQTKLASHPIIVTREPGGTPIGVKIRELLLSDLSPGHEMDFTTELLLFFADRAQHIKEIIQPNLKLGKLIICDRYYYSTLAYQHFGRGIERSTIDNLIKMVAASTLPDLVILVDIEPEIALKRAKSRANLDRIEKEDISFHTRIREGFLSLAAEDPNRFLILDGTETEESLEEKALKAINNLIA